MSSRGLKLAIAGVAWTLLTGGQALAVPAVNGEFDIPGGVGTNNEITQGPDGNMWVTRQNQNGVARVTPDGTVTPFPTTNTASGITVGPDNNLWVTTALGVAKIDPATGAELDTYDVGFATGGAGITAGQDGNLWAVAGDKLVRFSPADPEGTDVATAITGMNAKGAATGSDGLIWIADGNGFVHSATQVTAPTRDPGGARAGYGRVSKSGPNGAPVSRRGRDHRGRRERRRIICYDLGFARVFGSATVAQSATSPADRGS